jgi:hypothetical protein
MNALSSLTPLLSVAIFCAAGRSFDRLENRFRSISAFKVAISVDFLCVEALDYMHNAGILAKDDVQDLASKLETSPKPYGWLNVFRSHIDKSMRIISGKGLHLQRSQFDTKRTPSILENNGMWCFQVAESSYINYQSEEAYRFGRRGYSLDQFDQKGIIVYIASMVDLNLKTELFFLGKCLLIYYLYHRNVLIFYLLYYKICITQS